MTEEEHQYYRRDLIVCPVCNGSGKVARSSSEDDLLVDEGTYTVTFGEVILPSSTKQGMKPATTVSIIHWYR